MIVGIRRIIRFWFVWGQEAVSKVQPSAKREGFATIPDVSWDDVGSLGTVREELEFSISRPIKYPEEYQVRTQILVSF